MKCKNCGEEIDNTAYKNNKQHQRLFCDINCFNEYRKKNAKKVTRICQQCGKEFIDSPIREKFNRGKYCSIICRNLALARPAPITCICQYCGRTITKRWHQVLKGEGKFCSKECRNKSMLKQVTRTCEVCGKEFSRMPSALKNGGGRFCSSACSAQYHTGKNNGSYINGNSYGKYCEKFNEDFKRRVRAFFNNTCVECGLKAENNITGTRGNKVWKLSVHHVHYDKEACCNGDTTNWLFVPLCLSCHNLTGKKENREFYQKKFTDLINEKYGGKCYYTKEEYAALSPLQPEE